MTDQRGDVTEGGPWNRAGAGWLAVAAVALWALSLWVFFPGVMTYDSKDQYREALTGNFADWHPPIMAVLWRALHDFGDAGSPLFAVHLAAYWAAFGILGYALARSGRRGLAWITLALGLAPNLLLLSTFLHKDVGHAVAVTLAFSLIVAARASGRTLNWIVLASVATLLSYAVLVRMNGAFAAGPVVVFALAARPAQPVRRLLLDLAVTAALVAAALPASSILNRHVFHARPMSAMLSLVQFDLAGMAHFAGDTRLYPPPQPAIETVDRCYSPRYWDSLAAPDCNLGYGNGVKGTAKGKAWVVGILHHPVAYAEHRVAHFNETLFALTGPREWRWSAYDRPGLPPIPPGRLEGFTLPSIDAFANFPLTAPVVSLVLSMAILFEALRHARRDLWTEAAYVISLSGLLYTAGYALVGVASMYRYQQFGMTAAALGAVLILAGAPRADRARVAGVLALPTVACVIAVSISRLVLI